MCHLVIWFIFIFILFFYILLVTSFSHYLFFSSRLVCWLFFPLLFDYLLNFSHIFFVLALNVFVLFRFVQTNLFYKLSFQFHLFFSLFILYFTSSNVFLLLYISSHLFSSYHLIYSLLLFLPCLMCVFFVFSQLFLLYFISCLFISSLHFTASYLI